MAEEGKVACSRLVFRLFFGQEPRKSDNVDVDILTIVFALGDRGISWGSHCGFVYVGLIRGRVGVGDVM